MLRLLSANYLVRLLLLTLLKKAVTYAQTKYVLGELDDKGWNDVLDKWRKGGGGNGLLRSVSGKAEGPYADHMGTECPVSPYIDASLFEDDDGTVYFLCDNGKIARMTEDMTALAEELTVLKPANAEHVGFEGTYLFKAYGKYHLAGADFVGNDYHCFVASSDRLYGPYGDRYIAVPHGGHNMFFQDKEGQWWSTFFGDNANAPFKERPGALRVEFDDRLRISPVLHDSFAQQDGEE